MNHDLQNMEAILDSRVTGFHRIVLTEPAHLCFASENLCHMLQLSREELLSATEDRYAARVHPADREIYLDFLGRLRAGEPSLTAQYRLVRKDGTAIWVSDCVHTVPLDTGLLVGDSVLTDIHRSWKKTGI